MAPENPLSDSSDFIEFSAVFSWRVEGEVADVLECRTSIFNCNRSSRDEADEIEDENEEDDDLNFLVGETASSLPITAFECAGKCSLLPFLSMISEYLLFSVPSITSGCAPKGLLLRNSSIIPGCI